MATLTDEDKQRIQEEEIIRTAARITAETEAKSTASTQSILGFIVVVVVVAIVGPFQNNHAPKVTSNKPASFGSPTSSLQTTQHVAPPVSPDAKWRMIETFKGSSMKNTETFGIAGDEWRIKWAARPSEYGDGIFSIGVYGTEFPSQCFPVSQSLKSPVTYQKASRTPAAAVNSIASTSNSF